MSEKRKIIAEWSGILFVSCLLAAKGLGSSDGEPVFRTLIAVGGVFWLIKAFFTRWNLREAIFSAVFILVTFISYRMSGEKGILLCAMTFTAMKDMDLKKAFKVWTPVFGLSCIITVILFYLKIAPDYTSPRDKFGMHLTITNLGFPNHSVLSISYMVLVLMIIYTYRDRLKKWMYALMIAGCIWIFAVTFSLTGLIGTILGMALLLFRDRINEKVVIAAYPVCVLLSVLLPFLPTDSGVFKFCDLVFNGRLYLSSVFLKSGFITPFGIRIYEDKIQMENFYLDSSYVSALALCGVVTFAVFSAMYETGIIKLTWQKDTMAYAVLLTLLVCGLSEPFLFNTSCKNISLIFAGAAFYSGAGGFSLRRPAAAPDDRERTDTEGTEGV
ncbi:MAG: hypothetical protein K6E33_07595 [Lachnospiraceae bacterium]|nr:hypothetical protein [Lachnospiraceae bacterium]